MMPSGDALFDAPLAPEPEREIVRVTERTMMDALHCRYGRVFGNGRRYVVAEHVRSHASFDARRTADFIAGDLWQTGGLDLIGHEVKVSRGDWLRELAAPEKAAEFMPYMNRWWVVVSDAAIVRDGELPGDWGLLALAGSGLRVISRAPRHDAEPLTPSRLAALMRAVAKTAAAREAS